MKKWTLILLLSVTALSLMVVPAAAKTIKTEYDGESECGDIVGTDVWFSDDGVMHGRGGEMLCMDYVSDDRLDGLEKVIINYNFRFTPYPYGPMWGTLSITNEDGSWRGTWVGKIFQADGSSTVFAVLHGYGDYEGLQARATYYKDAGEMDYQISGVIMEPGGE